MPPCAELFAEPRGPALGKRLRIAFSYFIGLGLVDQREQQIAVQHGIRHTVVLGHAEREAGVMLQPRKTERNDRHIIVARASKRLAQQRYVVGCTAAAAGLKQDQRDLVRVVAPRGDRLEKLPDDQNRGITGVVVHIAEPCVDHLLPGGLEQFHFIAVGTEDAADQLKMPRQHGGHQNGVFFFHLLRKGDVGLRLHVTAPFFRRARRSGCAGGCAPRRGW